MKAKETMTSFYDLENEGKSSLEGCWSIGGALATLHQHFRFHPPLEASAREHDPNSLTAFFTDCVVHSEGMCCESQAVLKFRAHFLHPHP